MSIESRSNQYGTLFGEWKIEKMLGSGSGGRSAVFQMRRRDSDWIEYSALKVISLVEEHGSRDKFSQVRKEEYKTAVKASRKEAEQEVRLMEQLRGKTNIVDYLDYRFENWSDNSGFGLDLLIRMEMLGDLRSEIRQGRMFSEQEILEIGRNICQALIICHNKNILHRDIKPENIFFNRDGDYKLGDFGISRIMSNSPSAMASTGIGTPEYAAPEQSSGQYDTRVDIYSLGLVLYELANQNRLPFASSAYVRPEEVQKRHLGVPLPQPCGVSRALAQVILKACAYEPKDRYQTAQAFKQALDQLLLTQPADTAYQTVKTAAEAPTYATEPASGSSQYATAPVENVYTAAQDRKATDNMPTWKKYLPWGITAVALMLAFTLGSGMFRSEEADQKTDDQPSNETTAAVETTAAMETTVDPGEAVYQAHADHCAELERQGDLVSAVLYARELDTADARYAALLETYESKLKDDILGKANALADDNRLRLAIQTVSEVQDVYDCTEFADAILAYKQAFPRTAVIAAGRQHTAVLRSDGTVAAVGHNTYGQCDVSGWMDIVSISSGDYFTVGLRSNGTVLAVGRNNEKQLEVSGWTDIVALSAGDFHTVGLRGDGTLVTAGNNHFGKCDVHLLMSAAGQRQIIDVAAGYEHTLALLSDGTVLAIGRNDMGQCNVAGWTDIIAIYAGTEHSVGLKSDGTVVATGNNEDGQCNVSGWTDIDRLTAGDYFTAGIRSDGSVVFVGQNEYDRINTAGLTDVCAIGGGNGHIVATTREGNILSTGWNGDGQCNVTGLYY